MNNNTGAAQPADGNRSAVLLPLMIAGGIGFSLFFACATPFAAFSTVAALKLERRQGVAMIGLLWLANQVVGYGILHYPQTWDSLAWGAAIGVASLLAYLAAVALSSARPIRMAISLPFVAALVAYELALYTAGFALPGEPGAFAFAVVWRIFVVNLAALAGLLAVFQIVAVLGLDLRRRAPQIGRVSVAP